MFVFVINRQDVTLIDSSRAILQMNPFLRSCDSAGSVGLMPVFDFGAVSRGFVAIVAVAMTCVSVLSAQAQDAATPPAPEIIPGTECHTDARSIDFLGTLLATPMATETYVSPTVVPEGSTVDEATAAEINAVVREFIACSNSGEVLRALALLGDEYMRRIFDPSGELDRETADKLIKSVATPIAIAPEKLVIFLGIREMVALPDGRVAVVIETDGGDENTEGTDVDLFIFERQGERWIVFDAINDIDDLEAKATAEAGS